MLLADGSSHSGGGGYAVGWLTLALLNAGLAQTKQRSGLSWFLVSLFFGPVATFLIVVQRPLQEGDRGYTR